MDQTVYGSQILCGSESIWIIVNQEVLNKTAQEEIANYKKIFNKIFTRCGIRYKP